MSKGFFPWGLRLGSGGATDKPNVEYTGKASPVPADATSSYARLLDKGKKPLDNATLYSGQQLEGDGVDDHVDIGDISASCKSLEITIDPATTTEGVIQLASGVSVSISSGTITTAGLSNVTAYVNSVAGTAVAAELTVLALTFDAVSCSDVQLFYNGSDYFNGSQGNVKLWTETLDIDDVVFSYANPETPSFNRPGTSLTEAGLVERWPLIAGSGDTAYDWSGNGNHGVLTGFTDVQTAWDNAAGLSDPRVIQTALCEFGMGSNLLYNNKQFGSWITHDIASEESLVANPEGVINDVWLITPVYTNGRLDTTTSTTLQAKNHYLSMWVKPEIEGQTIKLRMYSPSTQVNTTIETVGLVWQKVETDLPYTPDGSESTTMYIYPDTVAGSHSLSVWNPQVSTSSADATVFPSPATNALTPIRTWEDTNQFTREYNELNWNGRSYADAGDGPDVNPSTAVIIETVLDDTKALASKTHVFSCGVCQLYSFGSVWSYFAIKDSSFTTYYSDVMLSAGVAHHVVCVFSVASELLTIYVDGIETSTAGSKPSTYVDIYPSEDPLTLGSSTTSFTGQLPLFRMITDAAAQKIIDKGLDAYVAKRYAKAQSKYNLGE